MDNQYKMRRMGGKVDRAEEVDSSNNFSVNQARTMNNYGMAQNSGLPYTDAPLNQNDPGFLEKAKNYLRNSSLNVKYTRPDSDRTTESKRIFGPTDKEIANQKRTREKNLAQKKMIEKIKSKQN